MKVLFMGTPAFAVPSLLALTASRHRIVAAVTRPDRPSGRGLRLHAPPVKEAAQERGLEVLQPSKVRDDAFLEVVRSLEPDVLAVVAFGRILPAVLLASAPQGGVNLHASLLPRYRGAAPVAWAIARGETTTGITTMRMTERLDAGEILLQRSTPIGEEETAGELEERLARIGAPYLVETLDALERGEMAGLPQDESQASWAGILTKQDGVIDWSLGAREIARRVRAFDPWPTAHTRSSRGTLVVWRVKEAEPEGGRQPGTILLAGREGLRVACGEGSVLEILEVQPQGGRRITGAQAAAGRHVREGERLG